MADARVVEIAKAVAAAIAAKFPTETVSFAFVTADEISTITTRKIYVFPGAYGEPEPATREKKFRDSTVGVMILNRHTDAGALSPDWVGEQMLFVESLWEFAGDETDEDLGAAIGDAWPNTSEVTLPYDDDRLEEMKLFQSEFTVTYRELR